MAVCDICHREMLDHDTVTGCIAFPVVVLGVDYPPIPNERKNRCHDCGCIPGEYHHRGCDMEICPVCENQLISCGCQNKTPMEALTKRTYRTDERYWREYAESLIPKGDGPTEPDTIAKYGVRLFDGEHWIRHYIDKPNGSVSTLCGLPCEFVPNQSQDVWKTCDACATELGRIRSR